MEKHNNIISHHSLIPLAGHIDKVNVVVWSSDESKVASGSEDGTVRVWSGDSGTLLHTMKSHTDNVYSVAWSPDGSKVASGSDDKTVRIWSGDSGALLYTMESHTNWVNVVAWSPDGSKLASGSLDNTVRVWASESGELLHVLEGHTDAVYSVAWSVDGRVIASGSKDSTVRIWASESGELLHVLKGHIDIVNNVVWVNKNKLASSSKDSTVRIWASESGELLHVLRGHSNSVNSVVWSADGSKLVTGSSDNTVRIWASESGIPYPYKLHTAFVTSVAWSADGNKLASSSDDNTVRIWAGESGALLHTLEGHTNIVYSVAWAVDGSKVVSGSSDNTVRIWASESGALLHTLEGHTDTVCSVAWSPDGEILVSLSDDVTMRLWHPQSWETVTIVEGITTITYNALQFLPHTNFLSSLDVADTAVHLWKIDFAAFQAERSQSSSVHYTTARIALVGDSSVGKSGLGYRLAESRFQVTESTHGQQFWIVDALGTTRDDGTQCEAILWDFAGQPTFRPIHALFLDDIDIALVLFDPTRPDTLNGVDYWLKHLEDGQHSCRIILVAARSDVSQLSLSHTEIQTFCREHNIDGGFVVTSAKLGEGIDTLLDMIRQQIGWNAKPTTVTTQTFKRIKDYVLDLKANPEQTPVLVNLAQLRSLLEASDPDWQFSDEELKGALSHLQNHGYITMLRRSSVEDYILLKPDLLINLAASYLFQAQKNERGLGALDEARVLRGEYRLPEVEDRGEEERSILLNAVTELFLKRNICFREAVDGQTFLIFPSLILDRPQNMVEDTTLDEDMTYIVSGKVENVYPALVVLLGYAPSFQRMYQWRKQAQYETQDGQICSFKLINNEAAELELVLYYGKDTLEYMRMRFQGLFEQILLTRSVSVKRYRPIVCPKCGYQQSRQRVIERIRQGKDFVFCEENGERISLPKATDLTTTHQMRAEIARDEARSRQRTSYETALVRLKGFIRDRGDTTAVTCFISYAWGILEHERWVLNLANDLRNAGIEVILDQLHNAAIGSNIARFIERIEESTFIVVIGTPSYLLKYRNKLAKYGSVVAAEVDLINQRLLETEERKKTVLPVLFDGDERTSLPPLMQRRVHGDFRQEDMYFATLFDLLLTLYQIPFEHPVVQDVRANLREEAQSRMKSGKIGRGFAGG